MSVLLVEVREPADGAWVDEKIRTAVQPPRLAAGPERRSRGLQGKKPARTRPLPYAGGLEQSVAGLGRTGKPPGDGGPGSIAMVYPTLVGCCRALLGYLRQGNGLYVTDWASMDNSPRNAFLANGGTAVDTSCQMAMFAQSGDHGRFAGQECGGPRLRLGGRRTEPHD